MSVSAKKKFGFIVLACAVSIGVLSAVERVASQLPEGGPYIEVGGPRIAYVPWGTQYVTYNGRVRKVARMEETLNSGEKDCKCPHCCEGSCYIIIFTDAPPAQAGKIRPAGSGGPAASAVSEKPVVILFIMWLSC
jgi:hypothetical protein